MQSYFCQGDTGMVRGAGAQFMLSGLKHDGCETCRTQCRIVGFICIYMRIPPTAYMRDHARRRQIQRKRGRAISKFGVPRWNSRFSRKTRRTGMCVFEVKVYNYSKMFLSATTVKCSYSI